MFALNALLHLAKIMIIFNGLNVTLNKVGGTFTTISSTTSTSVNNNNEVVSVSKSAMDILNIRHERSKQRRHSNMEKEQQLLPQMKRNLFEATSKDQEFHLKHQINKDLKNIKATAIADVDLMAVDVDTDASNHYLSQVINDKFKEFPKSFHLLNGHNEDNDDTDVSRNKVDTYTYANGFVNVIGNDSVDNVARHLNNVNKAVVIKSSSGNSIIHNNNFTSNIHSIFPSTLATMHHLTSPSLMPTTTLKAVTHKIRKLHKKIIVESMRQLNIDKFNANGGHLVKNHHRSLLEAEQLQKQTQRKMDAEHKNPISVFIKSTEEEKRKNDGYPQQQEQWQWLAQTTVATRKKFNRQQGPKEINNTDANESVNDGDLPSMQDFDGYDIDDGDDDSNSDDDNDNKSLDNDELTDILYQNDEEVSLPNNYDEDNDGAVANTGNNELLATTFNSMEDDKYEQHFKNNSSEFIKEIENNVDLEKNETDNLFSNHRSQVNDFTMKNRSHNYSPADSLNNTTERNNSNSFPSTEFSYDFSLSFEDHSFAPSLAAISSQGDSYLEAQQSFLYEKEEINFNDSSDLTQDDSSSLKDFFMDDAVNNDSDSASDIETEGILDIGGDDETNHFLEGVIDAANSEEIYDWDEISRSNRRDLMHGRDVVTKFLQIVETQHSLGSNCEAGTSLNLGEGVVDRYAQDRFRVEAEVAVNRANMLTRIFKMTSPAVQADVNLLHASVLSMVEFDDDIFAAGNCFDWNEHSSQAGLFCPFAYRLPPPNLGAILAKDLSMEYHYLGNTSEWFFQARKNAEKVIARNEQYLKAFHLYSNKTDERIEDDTLAVKYEDGRWSKPYYDCGGGNIWMLTYTVPFFGYENSTYHFKGTSGIDIDLRRVDIDQCPQRHIPGSTKPLNIFAGTDKCKQRTTMCEAIQGLGFRRGSYKCVCRKGYYFPDTTSQHKYFNGSLLEEEYEKLMLGKNSTYNIVNEYECLPCAEGCDSCEDGSPCIAALNWPMRTSILALACIVIGLLPPAAWFTFRYQQVKVVRAASPALLRVIALGAFFIYCTNIVMYPNPNLYTCTARIWLREIGFSLTYGALMLKTWRISVIFRVRSAKAVKITDAALLKRLGCICGAIGTCLLVRTLVSPPDVVVGRTADDLKAFLCKTDWWDYTFTSMEVVFLAWGVRLCIMVRKAPSEFNESRFISMAIYNEFLLTCFLNVSMLFLQSPANPDLLYIIFFCHTQLTVTLLLGLIFGSKVYIVLRSGKSHHENIGMGAKSSGAKFNFRPQVRTFANPSSITTSTVPVVATTLAENKLSDQEALEEIRQLSIQLQRIQEMAPPKGIAVMTISSLLDSLKNPGNMVMVAATGNTNDTGLGENQLPVCSQKPEALPLLSFNNEMEKYQQLQKPQKSSTITMLTTTNNNVAAMKTIPAITLPSTQVTPNIDIKQTNTGCWEEKAVNTIIIGNCIAEEELKKEQQHIICQPCYEKCKDQKHYQQLQTNSNYGTTSATDMPAKLNKCQMLGSPQHEGSISFKNIKLDCMCSQSDDLDQLVEQVQHQYQQTTRKVTKRSAATNTPPCTARKRTGTTTLNLQEYQNYSKDVKTQSTISLPSKETRCSSISTPKPISYKKQQTQEQQQQKQICDNCKNKFRRKEFLEGKKEGATRKSQQQCRNLSRLSNKCHKLLKDIEKSKSKATTSVAATTITKTPRTTAISHTTSTKGHQDWDEEMQNSIDDIMFYTTTDTSENDSDSEDDENADALKEDDISSSLSQSKSESKAPSKRKHQTATIELKCISVSLGNITTTNSITATSSTSSTSQSESLKSNNALSESNTTQMTTMTTATITTSASSLVASTTVTEVTSSSQQPQQPQQPPTNGSNGKAKRPDKLVLNLSDRSKFTKEVSV